MLMSEVKPFAAIYYNPEKIKNLSKVVCPPYDVISEKDQMDLYNASEYNYVRVLLGKDQPSDDKNNNRYTRAKDLFDKWLKEGILIQDEKPCLYFYKQDYKARGERHIRMGFMGLMKLPEENESHVFPHENTHTAAKEDRLKLWKALSANCSQIFVCFSDKARRVDKMFEKEISVQKPFMDATDAAGVRHVLWRLDDPAKIKEITDTVSGQPLFIADGHHRYEVALEYRRQKQARGENWTGKEPANYVMTYFTNMDSRDLKIFPIHRLVKTLPKNLDALEEFFRIDRLKNKDELAIMLAKAGQNEHAFGLYTRDDIKLLRLKNKTLIDKYSTEGSKEYRQLDAALLKVFVLDRAKIPAEDVTYANDLGDAMAAVDEGKVKAAFILNPVNIEQLKRVALNGERMPPKTTFFYPKVFSGLTIYKM